MRVRQPGWGHNRQEGHKGVFIYLFNRRVDTLKESFDHVLLESIHQKTSYLSPSVAMPTGSAGVSLFGSTGRTGPGTTCGGRGGRQMKRTCEIMLLLS